MAGLGVGPSGRYAVISMVTTPASSYDMTTLSTVKDELNINSDAASDSVLSRYISEASLAVSNFCNRVFVVETIKDRFFPSREVPLQSVVGGVDPVQLSRWPVVSVASVKEDGNTLVIDEDYILNKENGALIRLDANGYPTRWGAYPIVVEYVAGYPTIPADVSDAVIRTVCGRYYARGRDPLLRSETVPGVWEAQYWVATGASDAGGANLPPGVQSILDNYRVPVVA